MFLDWGIIFLFYCLFTLLVGWGGQYRIIYAIGKMLGYGQKVNIVGAQNRDYRLAGHTVEAME